MSILTLEQGVPYQFKQKLMEKLVEISDFLHLVIKEKVYTNRRQDSDDDRSNSQNSDEDEQSEHASANFIELFEAVENKKACGEHMQAQQLTTMI